MNDLYIDTHNQLLNLAILKDKKIIKKISLDSTNSHSKLTVFKIAELLKDCKISVEDIKNIIVVNGPGSFTGIRVGITIAKTLGYCKNINVYSIDYLYLQALIINSDSNFITSVSDKKGYFIGKFTKDKKRIGDYTYLKKEELEKEKEGYLFFEEMKNVNIESVYNKIKRMKKVNIHDINPIYIKKINV